MVYEFGSKVLDSGEWGERTATSPDKCFYKVEMEGKIKEECLPNPIAGFPDVNCWFLLSDVKRTEECKCEPMFCGEIPEVLTDETVSIHKGTPKGTGFAFKWCKVYATNVDCLGPPFINMCSGKKTTDTGSFRLGSFGSDEGTCTTEDGDGPFPPLVSLFNDKSRKCEKRLAAALNELTLEVGSHGIPCPGPAYRVPR